MSRGLRKKFEKLMPKDGRTPNWTFVIYEDSSREDWREVLDEYMIPWAESPWHDKDLDPNGEEKKKHKHVLISFPVKRPFAFVDEIVKNLGLDSEHLPPTPEPCFSTHGMVRYFAHLDNPDKVQYDTAEIRGHCGFDVKECLKQNSSERNVYIRQMMNFCIENKITEFADLSLYAEKHNELWFDTLISSGSFFMREFIKSLRHGGLTPFRRELLGLDEELSVDEDGVVQEDEYE